jgi:hypothetical protein
MGEVYEAEDTRLQRRVALKILRADTETDPARRAHLGKRGGLEDIRAGCPTAARDARRLYFPSALQQADIWTMRFTR